MIHLTPEAPLEISPSSLAAYEQGNTGVPYVHRFESGKSGPHVLISTLTHGNEFCGMVAARHLLDADIRPRCGTLTVSFNNVAAYNSFDVAAPYDSRQITHNLNRIFSKAQLESEERSIELDRARELAPVVEAADHVLDIHSTSMAVQPFWVYPGYQRNASVATALGHPSVHLVMPTGMQTGTPLTQSGKFGSEFVHGKPEGSAMVVECGQHFAHESGRVATYVTMAYLAHFGLVGAEHVPPLPQSLQASLAMGQGAQRRYKLLQTWVTQTTEFRFARPVVGFETFEAGELIAQDGEKPIHAPEGGCTLMMPPRRFIVGREAFYITQLVE